MLLSAAIGLSLRADYGPRFGLLLYRVDEIILTSESCLAFTGKIYLFVKFRVTLGELKRVSLPLGELACALMFSFFTFVNVGRIPFF